MKYRIRKTVTYSGDAYYIAEYKFLFFWVACAPHNMFLSPWRQNEEYAQQDIFKHKNRKSRKDIITYTEGA